MVKRLLSIICVVMLLFSLVACDFGGKKEEEVKPVNEEVVEEVKQEEKGEEIVEEVSNSKEESFNFSLGSWNEDIYTNDFLSMKVKMPSGWEKYSDEQIAQLMNLGLDSMDGDTEAMRKIAEQTSVYYLVISNPNTGSSVQVMTEKPLRKVSMDEYISSFKSILESQTTVKFTIGETKDIKLHGFDYKEISATATVNDISMAQNYYIRQLGDYFVCIIVTDIGGTLNINDFVLAL